jgi:hypothetical protein
MTEEGRTLPITCKPSSKVGAPTPVEKVRPVLTVVPGAADADDPRRPDGSSSVIDDLVREGARRMLADALQAEVDAYIAQFRDERDERGRRLVVRNGTHQPREVLTSAGAVEVVAPRVNDRRTDPQTGERCRFASAILPPWCRKTPKITEVLPLLYLHGLSSGDFVPALGQFLGSTAGLSAPVITRLTETWKAEQRTFSQRDLSGVDYVYLWADGIHVNIRLEEHKLCLLVDAPFSAPGRRAAWVTSHARAAAGERHCRDFRHPPVMTCGQGQPRSASPVPVTDEITPGPAWRPHVRLNRPRPYMGASRRCTVPSACPFLCRRWNHGSRRRSRDPERDRGSPDRTVMRSRRGTTGHARIRRIFAPWRRRLLVQIPATDIELGRHEEVPTSATPPMRSLISWRGTSERCPRTKTQTTPPPGACLTVTNDAGAAYCWHARGTASSMDEDE